MRKLPTSHFAGYRKNEGGGIFPFVLGSAVLLLNTDQGTRGGCAFSLRNGLLGAICSEAQDYQGTAEDMLTYSWSSHLSNSSLKSPKWNTPVGSGRTEVLPFLTCAKKIT